MYGDNLSYYDWSLAAIDTSRPQNSGDFDVFFLHSCGRLAAPWA